MNTTRTITVWVFMLEIMGHKGVESVHYTSAQADQAIRQYVSDHSTWEDWTRHNWDRYTAVAHKAWVVKKPMTLPTYAV